MSKSAIISWWFSYKKLESTCNITVKPIDISWMLFFLWEKPHTKNESFTGNVSLCSLSSAVYCLHRRSKELQSIGWGYWTKSQASVIYLVSSRSEYENYKAKIGVLRPPFICGKSQLRIRITTHYNFEHICRSALIFNKLFMHCVFLTCRSYPTPSPTRFPQ